jgi:ABC-type glycerol-3-phosphate transport system substrate-binding protein
MRPENIIAFLTNPSARKADAEENRSRFSDPRYQPFFQAAEKGGKWWITPNPGISDQMRIVHEASQAIILGQKTIKQGLTDAAADLEKTLKK